jgi:hypothetical protein
MQNRRVERLERIAHSSGVGEPLLRSITQRRARSGAAEFQGRLGWDDKCLICVVLDAQCRECELPGVRAFMATELHQSIVGAEVVAIVAREQNRAS